MQILYCDDCGIRLDDVEADDNTKVYCVQCAPRHAAEIKIAAQIRQTAAREAVRGRSTRTLTKRPSNSAIPRVSPADRAVPDMLESNSAILNSNTISDNAETALPAWKLWVLQNKPIAIGGAGVLVVVLIVVASMLMGPKKTIPPAPVPPERVVKVAPDTALKKPPENPVPPPSDSTKPDVVKPPPVPPVPPEDGKNFNPVLDFARRKLEALKVSIASGKLSTFETRQQLEWFMGSQLKNTPMQAEASVLLEKIKNDKKAPDDAAGAQPGIQARIGVGKAAERFDTDFKADDTRAVTLIDFPNIESLKQVFGRDLDFAVKFIGFIEVPKDGNYSFYISSDDGSALYIGNDRLINHPGTHAFSERDGTLGLKAGKHRFRLEYFQGVGAAGVSLSWSGPGIIKQIVPATALSSMPEALK